MEMSTTMAKWMKHFYKERARLSEMERNVSERDIDLQRKLDTMASDLKNAKGELTTLHTIHTQLRKTYVKFMNDYYFKIDEHLQKTS